MQANTINADELEATLWPAPVPLDSPTAPNFPAGALPGWAGAYADAVAESTETPRELAAMMTLATIATCAAKLFIIKPRAGRYFEPLNIWAISALEPGNRKSAVLGAVTAPLLEWERARAEALKGDIAEATMARGVTEGRIKVLESQAHKAKPDELPGLLEQIQAEAETLAEVPVLPRLWVDDVTPEKLGMMMGQHGERMAILSAEGGIFDILGGRYSHGVPNLDLFLKSHSGDSVRVDRGSREPVYLVGPSLTMGLSPQPELLRGLTDNPGFRGRGLLGRFLFTLPESTVGFRSLEDRPVPGHVEHAYHAGIAALLSMAPSCDDNGLPVPATLVLTDGAYAEWRGFSAYIETTMRPGGELEFIKDWAGKLPGAALRIAGLLHVTVYAHGNPAAIAVDEATIGKALELAAILVRHALAVFDLMGADPAMDAARHVWRWVERCRADSFTARDAFNALRGRFKRMADIEPAFEVLIERHHIRESSQVGQRRPGRPSRSFEVSPALKGGAA